MSDYRCDSGACPQITYNGDTVTIVEPASPGQVVVIPRASWDAYLDTVRAPLAAEIERLKSENELTQAAFFKMNADLGDSDSELFDARAEVERLRANQLPDGGKWRTEYGHDLKDGRPTWFDRHTCGAPGCNVQRRVWYGPAEPITEET